MQFFNKRVDALEQEIQQCLESMKPLEPTSEEYDAALTVLERLMKLESQKNSCLKVKPDTWAQIGGSLVGILVIVGYEHGHVLVSKALNHIIKGRV